ncbi:MAG: DUF1800 domain-containing protein [Bryobacteraceae bacterium]
MKSRLLSLIALASLATLPLVSARPDLFHAKLDKNQEVLHALNRLTYGPRPGDIAAVQKVGLKKWIDAQLHPESIAENPTLEARLAPLSSLTMTTGEITRNYPPPQVIAAIANGKMPLPSDPEKRAVLEQLAERYKAKLDKKGVENSQIPAAETTPLNDLLSPAEIRMMRKGTPEEKAQLFQSMPPEKLRKVVFALPQGARRGLFAYAPPEIRRKMLETAAPQQVVAHDLAEGKLYRAIYSERQLSEVLTDFWFNHFNVYLDKGADRFLVTAYERNAIRPNVLGKFRQMLEATAKNPAMLWYLDNWQSVSPDAVAGMRGGKNGKRTRGLNENYARELLELHTLGVDGGYTQQDIIEVARCFTGWTINQPYRGGGFEFNNRVHDKGEKHVLGVTIPAGGGIEDGLKVLDIVAHHPSTARFLSRKLAQRFVADDPPATLIDAMARTFQQKDGDLREVMRTMLASKEFWSQGAYHAKVKSPLEMVASAVRTTGADVTFAFGLANRIADLGQPLYKKQEPTGYSNTSAEWVNSAALLARMNFALALTQNKLPGVAVDAKRFEGDPAAVAKLLLSADASEQTRHAIERGQAEKQDPAAIAGLILGSPEFQRR